MEASVKETIKEVKKVKKQETIKFKVLPFILNVVVSNDGTPGTVPIAFDCIDGVIQLNDKVTATIFEDGSKGMTTKGDDDNYNREVGIDVATSRAIIKYLENHIKTISKNTIL